MKVFLRYDKDNVPIAFFPEIPVNRGNIMSYQHIGQHGESSVEYFRECKPAQGYEYDIVCLFTELKNIYGNLSLRKRINYNDLTRKAWKL